MKIVSNYTEENSMNFKMENGDFIFIEWEPFDGTDATEIRLEHTKMNEELKAESREYTVHLDKKLKDSRTAILEIGFIEGYTYERYAKMIHQEEVRLTNLQYVKPDRMAYVKKIIKTFYGGIAK